MGRLPLLLGWSAVSLPAVPSPARPIVPALVAAAGERAGVRFLEFFPSTLRNLHTRRAYARAVTEFLAWCEDHAVLSITAVQPPHVAAWIELTTRERAAPTVEQHLAAVRHCSNGWS